MSVPIIALVGRKNVGKSTLFNYLTHTNDALVLDFPGLTRDRKYGFAEVKDCQFVCIDTGGIENIKDAEKNFTTKQSLLAIEEADVVLFVVDARAGLMPADLEITKYLRFKEKQTLLVANKINGIDVDQAITDFWSLGFNKIYPIAASHGNGVSNLIDAVLSSIINKINIPKKENFLGEEKKQKNNLRHKNLPIKVAIIGRPNVGKSTIINRLLGEERVMMCDTPGTTRDSIYIPLLYNKRKYILIDTAGIRRSNKISSTVEKFSVIKSIQAIEDSNLVLLVIDAKMGIADQDLSLVRFILKRGRSLVIAVNKWDGLSQSMKEQIKKILKFRLVFVNFIRIHFISALHNKGISSLFESVYEAYNNSNRRISTSTLTRIMNIAVKNHQPPMLYGGRRIKLKYAHVGGYNPFIVVIHGNQIKNLTDSYNRYLINFLRKSLNMIGIPIHIQFKEGSNPYARKCNTFLKKNIRKRKYSMKYIKNEK